MPEKLIPGPSPRLTSEMVDREDDAPDGTDDEMRSWDLVESNKLFSLGVYDVLEEHRRNPRDGRVHRFRVQGSRDWATVVPVATDGRIVLVRQFRAASDLVTWEFPGGVVERDEPPMKAVVRELEEESGFVAAEVVHVASLRPNPALIRNQLHVFLARGCTATGTRNFDDSEDLDTFYATVSEIDSMVDSGAMDHALMVAAWLLVRKNLIQTV